MHTQKYYSYVLVYLLLLFKAGFFFVENYSRYTNLFLLAIAFIYIVAFKRKINKNAVFFSFATLLLEVVTYIFKGLPELEVYLSGIVDVLLALTIVSAINVETFKRSFANINYAICLASLLCLLLFTVRLPLYQVFPMVFNSHGEGAFFAFLSTPRQEFGLWTNYRIQGIYWEPGAFQFFIVVSALIDFYDEQLQNTQRFFRFLVYVISIFFTFSTTGILCGVIILFLYFYRIKKVSIVPLVVFICVILFIVSYGLIDEDSYLYYSIFGKLDDLNQSYEYGGSSNVTAEVRMNSLLFVLEEFLKSPIVGMGREGSTVLAQLGLTMTTFTPLNYFAYYGLLMGLLHVFGLVKSMRLRAKGLFEAIIVFSVLFLSTVSEQLAFNPILMCFSIYGLINTTVKGKQSIHKENLSCY